MSEKGKDKLTKEEENEIEKGAAVGELTTDRPMRKSTIGRITGIESDGVFTLKDRVRILERAILKPMRKGWRHPIAINAFSNYHRCARCGGEFEDEVVVVVERTRSGDHNHVFCSKLCLSNYNKW